MPDALDGIELTHLILPGLRLHVALAGPASGPLVVLLHGFPQFWYTWRSQIQALAAAGFRVVAPDQRGYNLSDKTPPYDIDTLVQDAIHLIQACGRDQACVAGHDWGAGVAWCLAAAYPERVRRLAILNVPHPAVVRQSILGGSLRQMLRSSYIAFFQLPRLPEWLLRRRHFALLEQALTRSARPGTFTSEDLAHYRLAWTQPGALTASLGWYRAMFAALKPDTYRQYARRIRPPALIVWGDRDQALAPGLADASAEWLDDGHLVRLPQASHWLIEEYPDEINRHLLAHFAGRGPGFSVYGAGG